MSGPKTKCPTCGSEWDGPVVFCGECGSPMGDPQRGPGDRAARLPTSPPAAAKRASTLVGSLPGIPVSPNHAPPIPDTRRTTLGMPAALPKAAERERAVTMVSPIAETKPGKGGRKRRPSLTNEADPRSEARPAPAEPKIVEVAPEPPKPIAAAEAPKPAPADDAPQIEVHEALSAPTTVETGKAPARESRPEAKPPLMSADAEEEKRLLEDLDAGFESIVRPSAPVVWLGSADPFAMEDAEKVLQALDAAPAAPTATSEEPTPSAHARAVRHEADMAEVRQLFAGIAVAYAKPLRDFMIEVAWGEPTREWLDVALPATQALRRAAAAVELPEVDAALEGYLTALELGMGEGAIHREVREMLAGAYAKLIDALPSVFALDGELTRREPIIVRSLLLQVPGVRHVAIEKLYRAGINALDVFYAARPKELAEATGLDLELAAAICDRFQRYKREVAELSPSDGRAKERAELASLADALAREHEAHERAASSWTAEAQAERNRARKERADLVLRIDLALARMGEVDLQRTIAKVPFSQKIRELRRYLDEASQRPVP